MDSTDTRLLEEWKANLDLLKFYETLKQQRFAHFLSIQTAFLAIFGLVAKEAIGVFSLVTLAALGVIPFAPLVIAFYFTRLDARGRAFVDTANTRLLLIEEDWRSQRSDTAFSTYSQQFGVLSRRDAGLVDRYVEARGVQNDPYRKLVQAPSAHASESSIIRLFFWVWLMLFSAGLVHLGWHLLHPQWRP
jgi:hypothetical protein